MRFRAVTEVLMKRNLFVNIIAYVAGAILLVFILSFLTKLVRIEYVDYTYGGYYDEEEDFDVLFVGSSRMVNGVFPMLLWKNQGITSFNYGAHANLLPSTYWVVENALQYRKPELVVVDVDGLNNDYKYATPAYLHSWLDSFPMSIVKLKTIFDLDNDSVKDREIEEGITDPDTKGTKAEYIWDYAKYHSRWDEIYETNFNKVYSPEKGAEARVHVTEVNPDNKRGGDEAFVGNDFSEHTGSIYLKKIIETCQSQGIEVLLIYLPCECTDSNHEMVANARKIAKDYEVNFVDFLDAEYLNPGSDYYDANHINPSGARKVTEYLGEYISETYKIADNRSDENIAKLWNEDYAKYAEHMNLLFERADCIENALVLSSYEDFDSIIEINNLNTVSEYGIEELLNNLGVEKDSIDKMLRSESSGYVVIQNGGENVMYYSPNLLPKEYIDCLAQTTEDDSKTEETANTGSECNIAVTVINKINGEVITQRY